MGATPWRFKSSPRHHFEKLRKTKISNLSSCFLNGIFSYDQLTACHSLFKFIHSVEREWKAELEFQRPTAEIIAEPVFWTISVSVGSSLGSSCFSRTDRRSR